jgi:hypothetical protein
LAGDNDDSRLPEDGSNSGSVKDLAREGGRRRQPESNCGWQPAITGDGGQSRGSLTEVGGGSLRWQVTATSNGNQRSWPQSVASGGVGVGRKVVELKWAEF